MRETFGVKPPVQRDLHLFSLSNFISIIDPILNILKPSSICEVGVEKEIMMQHLVDYCNKNKAKYIAVDPSIEVSQELRNNQRIFFYQKASLDVLSKIDLADIYLLDGDHNYYTVFNELLQIYELSKSVQKRFPLVILHDIGWPCDRRDFYYFPTFVPEKQMHDHNFDKGVLLNDDKLSEKGIKSENGEFAWSVERGGEGMGILTAIEDFMSKDKSLKLIKIPGVYGVGILYNEDSLDEGLKSHLESIENALSIFSDLLSSLEYNRLDQHIYITNRDKDFDQINLRLESAEKLAIERFESINQQSAKIDDLENNIKIAGDLAEKRIKAASELAEERLESINNQSKRIADLEISLNSANELADERFKAINNQSRRIDELTAELNHAKDMAEDRLNAINEQSSVINNLEANLSHANQLCEERLNSINDLAKKLDEANKEIQNQSNSIKEKDALIEYYRLPFYKKLVRKIKERD